MGNTFLTPAYYIVHALFTLQENIDETIIVILNVFFERSFTFIYFFNFTDTNC